MYLVKEDKETNQTYIIDTAGGVILTSQKENDFVFQIILNPPLSIEFTYTPEKVGKAVLQKLLDCVKSNTINSFVFPDEKEAKEWADCYESLQPVAGFEIEGIKVNVVELIDDESRKEQIHDLCMALWKTEPINFKKLIMTELGVNIMSRVFTDEDAEYYSKLMGTHVVRYKDVAYKRILGRLKGFLGFSEESNE